MCGRSMLAVTACLLAAVASGLDADGWSESVPRWQRARGSDAAPADRWLNLLSDYARTAGAGASADRLGLPRPIPVSLPLGRGDDGRSISLPVLILPVPVPAPAPERMASTQCDTSDAKLQIVHDEVREDPLKKGGEVGQGAHAHAQAQASPPPFPHRSEEPTVPHLDYVVSSQQLVELFQAQVAPDPELPPVVIPDYGGAGAGSEPEPDLAGEAPSQRRKRLARLRSYQLPSPGPAPPAPPAPPAYAGRSSPAPPRPRFDRSLMLRGVLSVPRAGYSEPYTVGGGERRGAGGSARRRHLHLPHAHAGRTPAICRDAHGPIRGERGAALRRVRVSRPDARGPRLACTPRLAGLHLHRLRGVRVRSRGAVGAHGVGRRGGAGRGAGGGARLPPRAAGGARARQLHHHAAPVLGVGGQLHAGRRVRRLRASLQRTARPTARARLLRARPRGVLRRGAGGGGAARARRAAARVHAEPPRPALRRPLQPVGIRMHAAPDANRSAPTETDRVDRSLVRFKAAHARRYWDDTEEAVRKNLLVQHSRFVSSGNRQGATFSMEMNHLGDRLDLELGVLSGVREEALAAASERFPHSRMQLDASRARLPTHFDWRQRGAVTPVRNQGSCSSCWAFAVTGAVEGALFLRTRTLVPLSERCLVDCAHPFGGHGCGGTWPSAAYEYVQARGLPALDDYPPYQEKVGQCAADSVPPVTHISAHVNVTRNNVDALKVAIRRHAPTVVIIDASPKSFTFYKKGVIDDERCAKNKAEHAVLAVGWGVSRGGVEHILVKNSWSAAWGDAGYARLQARSNTCGVLSRPSYPRLERPDVDRLPAATAA